MTILELFEKALGEPAGNLTSVLDEVANGGGELAPLANQLRTKLGDQLSGVDLAGVAHAVTGELADIAQMHFHPRQHPSDGA